MSECPGRSGEQILWQTVSREVEDILVREFSGDIVLHCLNGVVQTYHVNEKRKPGEERADEERRTQGPRNGQDGHKG